MELTSSPSAMNHRRPRLDGPHDGARPAPEARDAGSSPDPGCPLLASAWPYSGESGPKCPRIPLRNIGTSHGWNVSGPGWIHLRHGKNVAVMRANVPALG